jgi:hypothetical protein
MSGLLLEVGYNRYLPRHLEFIIRSLPSSNVLPANYLTEFNRVLNEKLLVAQLCNFQTYLWDPNINYRFHRRPCKASE